MKLNLEQLTSITRGAVTVEQKEDKFYFYRFTEAQKKAYETTSPNDFYRKSFATAGVRLSFRTNSTKFGFEYDFFGFGSSREYGYFDLYVNGAMEKHFGVDGNACQSGKMSIALPAGEKTLELYFPWSKCTALSEVELDDDATFEGVSRAHTMISFGDSITHGYDAIYPSLSYASQLAQNLDADQLNKGIGGDIFFPALLDDKDPIDPDYITVAYGTNDWSKCPREVFEKNCTEFYNRLSAMYPNAKIFAITPIWRGDGFRKVCGFGSPVTNVYPMIADICRDLPNVVVINPYNFVPHRPEFFADLRLHPNDFGFGLYAKGVYNEMVKHL